MVKPTLSLQLEEDKTQGLSSYSNTYSINFLVEDKELLARQVGINPPTFVRFCKHSEGLLHNQLIVKKKCSPRFNSIGMTASEVQTVFTH